MRPARVVLRIGSVVVVGAAIVGIGLTLAITVVVVGVYDAITS